LLEVKEWDKERMRHFLLQAVWLGAMVLGYGGAAAQPLLHWGARLERTSGELDQREPGEALFSFLQIAQFELFGVYAMIA
jgi:hypothetical protein